MSRKYYLQCPYCDKRLEREDLAIHIDKNHTDELPEDFTPLRVVYHVANKRKLDDPRKCRVCGRPCPWDEKKGRYDQLCGRPECKKKQAENMGNNMGDKLRSNSPTQSADGLEKMLAGRSISKKYNWSDGTVFVYTGSYEGNLLKWFDTVMEVKSEDLMVPGPTMYYEYEGEEHIYIPDFYYIPYNLIIEVKDGGDRPNTSAARRDSRLKTIAKEKHIVNKTEYNYIRLTNNDFSQLLAVFADLKMNMVESKEERVIHINEHTAQASIAPMIGMGNNDIVLVDYIKNRAFCGKSDLAISNTTQLTDLFGIDRRGKLDRIYKESLIDGRYSAYIVPGVRERVEKFLKEDINKEMDSDRIYEAVFGHKRYTYDQILFEDGVIPCCPFEEILQEGLFKDKKPESLSNYRKVRINVSANKQYKIFKEGVPLDNYDGYLFVDDKGVAQYTVIIKKKGDYNRRQMIVYTAKKYPKKDAPVWDELGKLIVKELKVEYFEYLHHSSKNNAFLTVQDIKDILVEENRQMKPLIDNGIKYEYLGQSESGTHYIEFYTGSKPKFD